MPKGFHVAEALRIVIALSFLFAVFSSSFTEKRPLFSLEGESYLAYASEDLGTPFGESDSGTKIYRLPGPAKALEKEANPSMGGQITGKLITVDATNNLLMVNSKKADIYFFIDKRTRIVINGMEKGLADLKKGDKVIVKFRIMDSKNIAIRIMTPITYRRN